MIVLDTDVLSAMMRPNLNPVIVTWLDQQDVGELRITIVSLHELAYGVALLPRGRRRDAFAANLAALEVDSLGTSMLLLTPAAAHRAAVARAAAEAATGHCDVPDALIAGIALANGGSVATRNISHFQHFGVPLINPWAATAR